MKRKNLVVTVFIVTFLFVGFVPMNASDSSSPIELGQGVRPTIGVTGDQVHVVFTYGHFIKYFRSIDNGETWVFKGDLVGEPHNNSIPIIVTQGERLHVTWDRDFKPWGSGWAIMYRRSNDAGDTWEPSIKLTSNVKWRTNGDIDVVGDNIYSVWMHEGTHKVWFKRSLDSGDNWQNDLAVGSSANWFSPRLAGNSSYIHVVWQGLDLDYYYRASNDYGLTWGITTRLTYNNCGQHAPLGEMHIADIEAKANDVHILFQGDKSGNYEIYYMHSGDFGNSWSYEQQMSYTAASSRTPIIKYIGNTLYAVWAETSQNPSVDGIYLTYSEDNGASWSQLTKISPDEVQSSINPDIIGAQQNHRIHVVWNSLYDHNVYYLSISKPIPAAIDIDPDTLNLKSKGKWITGYIELPGSYDINEIDPDTVKLHYGEDSVSTEWANIQGTICMVKFDRNLVKTLLDGVTGEVELKVTGEVAGHIFEAYDTIRVIN